METKSIRKVIELTKCGFAKKKLTDDAMQELEELEKLAEIGKAIELLIDKDYEFSYWDKSHMYVKKENCQIPMDLLYWYRNEVQNEKNR